MGSMLAVFFWLVFDINFVRKVLLIQTHRLLNLSTLDVSLVAHVRITEFSSKYINKHYGGPRRVG